MNLIHLSSAFVGLHSITPEYFKLGGIKMNIINVGNRIRSLRKTASLSAKSLAEKVDLDPSQISKIEKGTSTPSLEALARICTALDISLSDFFKETDIQLTKEQTKLLNHVSSMSQDQIKILNKFLDTFLN